MTLKLFPFTLTKRARQWLHSLPPNSIRTWNDLYQRFMAKFYPVSLTNQMRQEIQDFKAKPNERFHEAWECFYELLIKCPHHNVEPTRLMSYFFQGLHPHDQNMIQSMHQGKLMYQRPMEAFNFLMDLSVSMQT